jgi:glutamate-1-semialdehyde 2,1-aminomutase
LSWVGTGRFIFSLDFPEAEFDAVADRIVAAAQAMEADGWWWQRDGLTDRAIRRQVLHEMLRARFGRPPVTAPPPQSEAPAARRA